mmetsp:Transcript_27629/g.81227  ORF Transcript_27629/g.81227 Transcript_27629/m.81227 type:complete len:360 (-) Transcript_27629:58-1137(-)|eukprot:CAMPEP_0113543284 /NCGR_PEP_ID=MMETSP0015_2-20120614/10073_1 /TAXON_ID=2838 /ORGANISM="Odontella" /LENGTH=359 /DNA_ID=CAMNT_0000443427 /DNA_START=146 /DNA_END=1225 /DNA_ORIENTATION=+ /assembly_acc=CAM_ASM_000160
MSGTICSITRGSFAGRKLGNLRRHPNTITLVSAALLFSTLLVEKTYALSTSSSAAASFTAAEVASNNNNKKKQRPRVPVLRYENNYVCVNKPAGLTVHRAKGMSPRKLVLSTLLKRQLSRKVFPVHRLDHRTSGAILFAFDSETTGKLHSSLRSDSARKQYVALLRGDMNVQPGETVTVTKPLKVDGVEKTAITDFTLLASMAGSDDQRGDIESRDDFVPACSLVMCEPKTGRFHQIRRHAYALSHPVLGDTEHGDTKVNRWWRNNRSLNRLALHCFSLELPPMSTGDSDTSADSGEGSDNIQCLAPLSLELLEVLQGEGMEEIWQEALQREPRLAAEFVDLRGGSFGRNFKKTKQENS